jgi:hypothetical protein
MADCVRFRLGPIMSKGREQTESNLFQHSAACHCTTTDFGQFGHQQNGDITR